MTDDIVTTIDAQSTYRLTKSILDDEVKTFAVKFFKNCQRNNQEKLLLRLVHMNPELTKLQWPDAFNQIVDIYDTIDQGHKDHKKLMGLQKQLLYFEADTLERKMSRFAQIIDTKTVDGQSENQLKNPRISVNLDGH